MTPSPPSSALSLSLPVGYGVPAQELIRLIEHADQTGLAGVAVGEPTSTDAIVLLAAAAPLTSNIRLETSVLSVLTHAPSLFAMSAATLADLSNGRFVLGLGAGSPIVAGYHGLPFEHPAHRVEQWLTDIRRALAGEALPEWGSFRIRGLEAVPVPLLLAAMNPRMIDIAGRRADGVILNFCGPAQVGQLAGRARSERSAAGVDQPFEVHTTLWADASGDVERARARFRSEMAPYLAVPTYQSAVVALSDPDAIDRASSAWATGGRDAAAALFPESIVDAMLATDASELAAKTGALVSAGCTGVRVTPLTHESGTSRYATLVVEMMAEASALMTGAETPRTPV